MSTAAAFVGDVPRNYDRALGPVMFAPYAADLARRCAALRPKATLETACGTGIVTRVLRDALAPGSRLVATDLNAPMLDVAREKFSEKELVSFEPADAMALSFSDGAFDMVVSAFGVMFFPERLKAFREARRVLKTGGRFVFNVWDAREKNAFARIASEVATAIAPNDPPRFYETPFSCSRIDPLRETLEAAGFGSLEVAVVPVKSSLADVAAFARGLVFGNPLAEEIRARGGDPDAAAARIEARLRGELGAPARPLELQAIVFSAVAV